MPLGEKCPHCAPDTHKAASELRQLFKLWRQARGDDDNWIYRRRESDTNHEATMATVKRFAGQQTITMYMWQTIKSV